MRFVFVHFKALAIFKKICFQGPIRPLVQIVGNLETYVKYFLMLYLPKKFRVAGFNHCKILAILNKKSSFQGPIPGPNFEKPRDTCHIFLHLY